MQARTARFAAPIVLATNLAILTVAMAADPTGLAGMMAGEVEP